MTYTEYIFMFFLLKKRIFQKSTLTYKCQNLLKHYYEYDYYYIYVRDYAEVR